MDDAGKSQPRISESLPLEGDGRRSLRVTRCVCSPAENRWAAKFLVLSYYLGQVLYFALSRRSVAFFLR